MKKTLKFLNENSDNIVRPKVLEIIYGIFVYGYKATYDKDKPTDLIMEDSEYDKKFYKLFIPKSKNINSIKLWIRGVLIKSLTKAEKKLILEEFYLCWFSKIPSSNKLIFIDFYMYSNEYAVLNGRLFKDMGFVMTERTKWINKIKYNNEIEKNIKKIRDKKIKDKITLLHAEREKERWKKSEKSMKEESLKSFLSFVNANLKFNSFEISLDCDGCIYVNWKNSDYKGIRIVFVNKVYNYFRIKKIEKIYRSFLIFFKKEVEEVKLIEPKNYSVKEIIEDIKNKYPFLIKKK